MPTARDEPAVVVEFNPLQQSEAQFLGVAEVAHPEELLLEGAEEALDASVALRQAHEGRAGDHADES